MFLAVPEKATCESKSQRVKKKRKLGPTATEEIHVGTCNEPSQTESQPEPEDSISYSLPVCLNSSGKLIQKGKSYCE